MRKWACGFFANPANRFSGRAKTRRNRASAPSQGQRGNSNQDRNLAKNTQKLRYHAAAATERVSRGVIPVQRLKAREKAPISR